MCGAVGPRTDAAVHEHRPCAKARERKLVEGASNAPHIKFVLVHIIHVIVDKLHLDLIKDLYGAGVICQSYRDTVEPESYKKRCCDT